jgi:hypothetical protein
VARLAAATPPTAETADSTPPLLAQAEPESEDPDPDGDATAADVELAANAVPITKPQPQVEPLATDPAPTRMTVGEVHAAIRAALAEAGQIPAHTPDELIPPELKARVPHDMPESIVANTFVDFSAMLRGLRSRAGELILNLLERIQSIPPPPAPDPAAPPTFQPAAR